MVHFCHEDASQFLYPGHYRSSRFYTNNTMCSFRPVRLSPHTKAEPGSNMYFRTISENGQCTRYKNRLNRDVMQILHNIKCSFTAPTVKGSI